jgi:NitT/TauT family transport system substrate-binding protein
VLNGLASGQQAGFVYAQALGYYAEEGIDLHIDEGHGSDEAVQSVASGRSEFGYADGLAIIRARAAGSRVTAVSTVFQSPSLAIVSLQPRAISQLSDLHGQSVAVSASDDVARAVLDGLLADNGLGDAHVIELSAAELVPALRARRVAAIVGQRDVEVLQLQRDGEAVAAIPFAGSGVELASLSIVAQDELIARDPTLVAGFVHASLRGWAAARANPDAAGRAVVERFLAGYEDEVAAQLRADLPLLCGRHNSRLGQPPEAGWSATLELATRLGLVAPTAGLDGAYTDRFIPADAPRCGA